MDDSAADSDLSAARPPPFPNVEQFSYGPI